MSAQDSDGYVYAVDVINKGKLTWKNTYFGTLQTDNATYASTLYPGAASILFDAAVPNDGVVVIASNHILGKIEIGWNESQQGITGFKSSLMFVTSTEAFSKTKDLHTLADDAFTEVDYPSNLYIPKGNYYYWGIKTGKNTSDVLNLSIYWHLTYVRENLTVGNLGTICLPYDVKAEDLADELTPYTIVGKLVDNSLGENNVEALIFEEVEDLKAGVAYIFLPKKNDICLKYFGTKVASPLDSKVGFIGTFEKHVFTEDECQRDKMFVISQNRIALVGVGLEMGANRAYIKMSDVPVYQEENSSRKLVVSADGYIEMGGNLTTVEMLKAISSLKSRKKFSSSTFDLYGRILGDATTNGVILQNGKKKIVRVK